MKIAQLHVYQYDLPVKNGPYSMSFGEIFVLDTTLVKLVTNTGIVGWGETRPLGPIYAEAHAEGALAALTSRLLWSNHAARMRKCIRCGPCFAIRCIWTKAPTM